MDKKIFRSCLLNLPVAGDVDTTSQPGYYKIRGLAPIPAKDYIGQTVTVGQVEIVQRVKLFETSLPVITASTLYKIKGGSYYEKELEYNGVTVPYGATSPAVLSGSAATDRHNVFTSLAYRLNNQKGRTRFYAGALVTLTHVGSTVFTVNANKDAVWVKATGGTASGCIGFIIANADSSATTTNLCVYNGVLPVVGDIFTVINNPITGVNNGAGGPSTAVTVVVLGNGLRIVDIGNYYDPKNQNFGATTWKAVAGITQSNIVVSTAAQYQRGIGATMLTQVPVVETSSSNIIWGGDNTFPTNEAPVSGNTYNFIDIQHKVLSNNNAMGGSGGYAIVTQRVYAYNGAAGYAAFAAAVAALT